jgi:hypothetical protein
MVDRAQPSRCIGRGKRRPRATSALQRPSPHERLQRRHQLLGRPVPLVPRLFQAPIDDRAERADIRPPVANARHRVLGLTDIQQLERRAIRERVHPGEHLVQQDPHGPQIAPRVDALGAQLLG